MDEYNFFHKFFDIRLIKNYANEDNNLLQNNVNGFLNLINERLKVCKTADEARNVLRNAHLFLMESTNKLLEYCIDEDFLHMENFKKYNVQFMEEIQLKHTQKKNNPD